MFCLNQGQQLMTTVEVIAEQGDGLTDKLFQI